MYTSHENSAAAYANFVKLEVTEKAFQNIASAINPSVPKKGIEQAFACLYFLAKQRITHTTIFEPLLGVWNNWD